jgi:hypothetical protein
MGSHSITPRDRVWAAIIKQAGRFQVADVREAIAGDRPSDETIRRVLRSATELDIVTHQSGSPYWRSGTALAGYLAPKGVDTAELLTLTPDKKKEDVIFTEEDEEIVIEDIISEARATQFAQSGHPDGDYIPVNPSVSDSERWKSAFRKRFADADHIVIIDTSTGDLVDLSDHLDMDQFEHGTKILPLGELRDAPLFLTAILNALFQSHRADLAYQEVSGLDDREIEEYVRTEVRSFEPEPHSPEWMTLVESLGEEVVEMVDPTDPGEQSRIAEWVRSIAREEADN